MVEFAIKLPGFSLSVLPYLGGADYLRYGILWDISLHIS